MTMQRLASLALVSTLVACNLDVPDLNNPSLPDLENNPTAVQVEGAATGLLIGNRSNAAAANGYVSQLGILGRESFNFDAADPRFLSELIAGTLNQGSPFGGNFWAFPYANIRLANVILAALDKLSDDELSADNKTAIRGFTNTLQAMDLLIVINAHDTNGAVIDTDVEIVLPPAPQPLGDIVSKEETFARIAELLDSAAADLASLHNADDPESRFAFPFLLSAGYAGFDTAEDFLKFNRAIRARVAAYMKDYPTALDALEDSFLDDDVLATPDVPLSFTEGVYHVYSTKTGDATNALLNPNIFAHPLLETEAQKNGQLVDARYSSKVRTIDEANGEPGGSFKDTKLASKLKFTMYTSPASRVPIIRNEELILLKAEALFYMGDPAGALAELNIVRTNVGKLAPLVGVPTEASFLDQLLYERRYSLLFEGGHRWIDLRRFGRMEQIVLEEPSYKRNARYPIPLQECNARPGEPACELGSE